MKTPVMKVADYLANDEQLVGLMTDLRQAKITYSPIFTSTPDDKFIKASSAPWIRVTPIPGDDAIYSDDARLFEYPRVQVDFWIKEENANQLQEIQERIYETLHSHNYERYYKNYYPDPDLDGCLMVTANFEGFEERNDI